MLPKKRTVVEYTATSSKDKSTTATSSKDKSMTDFSAIEKHVRKKEQTAMKLPKKRIFRERAFSLESIDQSDDDKPLGIKGGAMSFFDKPKAIENSV